MLSHFSHVRLFATPWTVACQAPMSMGFFRQEYWSGLPCPPPGDLPDPEINPCLLHLLHCRGILHRWQRRKPKNSCGKLQFHWTIWTSFSNSFHFTLSWCYSHQITFPLIPSLFGVINFDLKMWKWQIFYVFTSIMRRADSLEKKPWCWERLEAGGEEENRGWDGWMASLTRWTWVWVDSGSWW